VGVKHVARTGTESNCRTCICMGKQAILSEQKGSLEAFRGGNINKKLKKLKHSMLLEHLCAFGSLSEIQ